MQRRPRRWQTGEQQPKPTVSTKPQQHGPTACSAVLARGEGTADGIHLSWMPSTRRRKEVARVHATRRACRLPGFGCCISQVVAYGSFRAGALHLVSTHSSARVASRGSLDAARRGKIQTEMTRAHGRENQRSSTTAVATRPWPTASVRFSRTVVTKIITSMDLSSPQLPFADYCCRCWEHVFIAKHVIFIKRRELSTDQWKPASTAEGRGVTCAVA